MRLPCMHKENSLCLKTSFSQTGPFLQLPWEQKCANSPVLVVSSGWDSFCWVGFSPPLFFFLFSFSFNSSFIGDLDT